MGATTPPKLLVMIIPLVRRFRPRSELEVAVGTRAAAFGGMGVPLSMFRSVVQLESASACPSLSGT